MWLQIKDHTLWPALSRRAVLCPFPDTPKMWCFCYSKKLRHKRKASTYKAHPKVLTEALPTLGGGLSNSQELIASTQGPQGPYCGSASTWGLENSQLSALTHRNRCVDFLLSRGTQSQETQNAILTTETRHLRSSGMVAFAFVVSYRLCYQEQILLLFFGGKHQTVTSHVMKECYH